MVFLKVSQKVEKDKTQNNLVFFKFSQKVNKDKTQNNLVFFKVSQKVNKDKTQNNLVFLEVSQKVDVVIPILMHQEREALQESTRKVNIKIKIKITSNDHNELKKCHHQIDTFNASQMTADLGAKVPQ